MGKLTNILKTELKTLQERYTRPLLNQDLMRTLFTEFSRNRKLTSVESGEDEIISFNIVNLMSKYSSDFHFAKSAKATLIFVVALDGSYDMYDCYLYFGPTNRGSMGLKLYHENFDKPSTIEEYKKNIKTMFKEVESQLNRHSKLNLKWSKIPDKQFFKLKLDTNKYGYEVFNWPEGAHRKLNNKILSKMFSELVKKLKAVRI
jgi:hypothetical protein